MFRRRGEARRRGRVLRRTGLGLLIGAAGGWLAGLMRAPQSRDGSRDGARP